MSWNYRYLMLLTLAAQLPLSAEKRRIAVEPFDYSAVLTEVQQIFGTHSNIGQGIAAIMTQRIARDGKLTVVERRRLGKVMDEQDLGGSGRIKRGTEARTGQIRGAELVLMGDIVVFGRDDNRKSVIGGVIVPGAGGVGGGRKSENKAVVVINFRVVDSETSEIVATGEARGESKRTSKGGFAGLFVGGLLLGGGASFTTANFAETIIGEATIDACNKLAEQVNTQAAGVNSIQRALDIDARVADVNGPAIIINKGSADGLAPGTVLRVSRILRTVKDPESGQVLDLSLELIGTLTIQSVRERIATGQYSGAQPPKVGDAVRSQ